jgi:hypothetical protein
LSDPNETASQVFESRGVRAKFFQARFNPLNLTERLLPVLSKSRCELRIGAVEPLRKMVQGVDTRPFHRMGIAQPSDERVRLVCHGLSPLCPALTKGSTSRHGSRHCVQPEDLPGRPDYLTTGGGQSPPVFNAL